MNRRRGKVESGEGMTEDGRQKGERMEAERRLVFVKHNTLLNSLYLPEIT